MSTARTLAVLLAAAPAVTARTCDVKDLQPRILALIEVLPAQSVRDLALAAAVADHPLTALLYSRRLTPLSRQQPSDAATQLKRMASSRLPPVRAIATGIRRAAAGVVYAGKEASDAVKESAG